MNICTLFGSLYKSKIRIAMVTNIMQIVSEKVKTIAKGIVQAHLVDHDDM